MMANGQIELQRNTALVLDAMQVVIQQSGAEAGWAKLTIREDQLLSEEGYSILEIGPSEMRDLRDWLNKNVL